MPVPILTTKLVPPPRREGIIKRPRLYRQLDEGLTRRLTLLSAPAGFGKTTLLSDWLHQPWAEAEPVRVGWVTLDESDNEPDRFWSYVIAALQRPYPGLGEQMVELLQSPHTTPDESLLILLLNDLAAIASETILVLDDFHTLTSEQIYAALNYFLDYLPQHVHLFIATRVDPPLPLARLRARDHLMELRAADLRFTSQETEHFLHTTAPGLTPEQITALQRRTEGWPVGLQLAALSLKGRINPDRFIQDFAGSHRYILDYLSEEVLEPQPEDVQTFLMQTAVLEELTGSLCNAVTGRDDSRRLLDELARANLFIAPVDEQHRWYRYHRLFADLLQRRLRHRMSPHEIETLHRRATAWYEQAGMIDKAIDHALEAHNFDKAGQLLEDNLPKLFRRYRFSVLLNWLETLPKAQLQTHPALELLYAWLLFFAGRPDETETHLQAVEQALDATPEPTFNSPVVISADRRMVTGAILALRAQLTLMRGNLAEMVELSVQALEHLSTEQLILRGITLQVLGLAYWLIGNEQAASRILSEPAAANGEHTIIANLVNAGNLAELHKLHGRLTQAARLYEHILGQLSAIEPPFLPMIAGATHVELGFLQYEWNNLTAAEQHFRHALELGLEGGGIKVLGRSHIGLMLVLLARGQTEQALETLRQLETRTQEMNLGLPQTILPVWYQRVWIARGDLHLVESWVQEQMPQLDSAPEQMPFHTPFLAITLIRALLALGKTNTAFQVLQRLEYDDRYLRQAEIRLQSLNLKALLHQANQQLPQALETLEEALTMAEPEGYIRSFVDEGPAMAALLLRLINHRRQRENLPATPSADYLNRLLQAFGVHSDLPDAPLTAPDGTIIEPLTERETEILQLLAAGLSNDEIAGRLVIARSTLKTHLKNIYGKLNVHSRLEAVARAKELSLL